VSGAFLSVFLGLKTSFLLYKENIFSLHGCRTIKEKSIQGTVSKLVKKTEQKNFRYLEEIRRKKSGIKNS